MAVVLRAVGFRTKMRNRILALCAIPSARVRWNGSLSDAFTIHKTGVHIVIPDIRSYHFLDDYGVI